MRPVQDFRTGLWASWRAWTDRVTGGCSARAAWKGGASRTYGLLQSTHQGTLKHYIGAGESTEILYRCWGMPEILYKCWGMSAGTRLVAEDK